MIIRDLVMSMIGSVCHRLCDSNFGQDFRQALMKMQILLFSSDIGVLKNGRELLGVSQLMR